MKQLVLKNVKYFDSELLEYKYADAIHIVEDQISSIDGPIPEGIPKLDCIGKFVLPGFIDSHIHFFQSGGLYTRPDGLDLRHVKPYQKEFDDINSSLQDLFKRYLATGITGVIDCGGPFWNFKVLEKGKQSQAPRIAVAGPLVSTVSREKLDLGDPPIIKASSEDQARDLVRNCAEYNPVFIKMWFIYQEDKFEEHSKIMKAAIEESHKCGYRAAVHATELETARRAVEYGADILVHSVFDKIVDEEFIELLKSKKVIYNPTLMVRYGYRDVYRTRHQLSRYNQIWGDPKAILSYRDLMTLDKDTVPEPYQELREQYEELPEELNTASFASLKLIAEAGVTIAAGTDAGNVGTLHGPALHTEMELMVYAGMNPEHVIQSATLNAAKLFGKEDIGNISGNMVADLVILDKDPLQDIKNTTAVWRVIKGGQVIIPGEVIKPIYPKDIIDNQVKAYNSRNIEEFLSYYHPRVEIYNLQNGELQMKGLAEMKERYSILFDTSPDLMANIVNRITLGDIVIDHEEVTGFRGDNTVHAIAHYEVRNHLITRVWFSGE